LVTISPMRGNRGQRQMARPAGPASLGAVGYGPRLIGLLDIGSAGNSGFGLFGTASEGAVPLGPVEQTALRQRIMAVATSDSFIRRYRLDQDAKVHDLFLRLVNQAEVTGSTRGGAAGLLQLAQKLDHNPHVLRIAIQIQRGFGTLWGLIPVDIIIRHELLHFVREAQSMTHHGVSLFESEIAGSVLSRIWLMLREEFMVWWKTLVR
jgi:hypothetical protein